MAAIPVLFSMAEPARPLNIPDSLDINEADNFFFFWEELECVFGVDGKIE
jgi:hypothetical protein